MLFGENAGDVMRRIRTCSGGSIPSGIVGSVSIEGHMRGASVPAGFVRLNRRSGRVVQTSLYLVASQHGGPQGSWIRLRTPPL